MSGEHVEYIEVRIHKRILVPSPFNYLRLAGSEEAPPVDIAHISDEDLRLIGEAWTKSLIENAARRRETGLEGEL